MPYKDKEKQKAYQREYRKKERQMLKELRAKQKLDSSVQLVDKEDKKHDFHTF